MAIATLDQYIAAVKQRLTFIKTASATAVATFPQSVFAQAGNPGAGVLAGTSVAAGVVPTNATAGCLPLNSFSGIGYVSKVEFGNQVACWIDLYDMVWKAGAYAFSAAQTLSAQPSYSGRVPGGTDFTGLQLWVEAVTAFTGNLTIAVTYTNQAGATGHTTGTVATGIAPILGRCVPIPLASGDSGLQKVETVTSTVATVGTFNVLVLRPVWSGRCIIANGGDVHDLLRTGMVQIWNTSALVALITPDSTATGIPELVVEVASA